MLRFSVFCRVSTLQSKIYDIDIEKAMCPLKDYRNRWNHTGGIQKLVEMNGKVKLTLILRKEPWDLIKYPQRTQLKHQVFFILQKKMKKPYAPYARGFSFLLTSYNWHYGPLSPVHIQYKVEQRVGVWVLATFLLSGSEALWGSRHLFLLKCCQFYWIVHFPLSYPSINPQFLETNA